MIDIPANGNLPADKHVLEQVDHFFRRRSIEKVLKGFGLVHYAGTEYKNRRVPIGFFAVQTANELRRIISPL